MTRLVFIDETWASTNMARKRGRAREGERLRVGIPSGHWKTTTFVAGLRVTEMRPTKILHDLALVAALQDRMCGHQCANSRVKTLASLDFSFQPSLDRNRTSRSRSLTSSTTR